MQNTAVVIKHMRERIEALEHALRVITFVNHATGEVHNKYIDDVDLSKYAPLLRGLHKEDKK